MKYTELEEWCKSNGLEYIESNTMPNPDRIYIAYDGLNIAELSKDISGYVRTHYLEIDGFKYADVKEALQKTFDLAVTPIEERLS